MFVKSYPDEIMNSLYHTTVGTNNLGVHWEGVSACGLLSLRYASSSYMYFLFFGHGTARLDLSVE